MTYKGLCVCGFTFLVLVFLNAVPCQSVTHYCQQNVINRITGETEGLIVTRKQGESQYGDNYKCKWLIDAGENMRLKLTVLSTDLEWAPTYTTCSGYDNLQIIEGETDSGKVITSLCGSRNPYQVVSQGRYIFLIFLTTHQNFGEPKGIELMFEVFDNNTCPPGWFSSDNTWSSSDDTWCYSLNSKGTASWLKSQIFCSYSQANLASITSAHESSLIFALGVNQSVSRAWIGLSDLGTEGNFGWIDEQKLSFQKNFLSSTPNEDEIDCVAQDFTTGEWVLGRCDTVEQNYICKARKKISWPVSTKFHVDPTVETGLRVCSNGHIPLTVMPIYDGTTKIYFTPSDSPEPGGEEEKINFVIIIIVIVLVVVLIGVVIIVIIVKKKRNKPKQKQELSTTRYPTAGRDTAQEMAELDPSHQGRHPIVSPSAPQGNESVMTFDTQMVAPPTYEESQYHQVAPSEY